MTRMQRKTHLLLWGVLGPIALVGLVLAVLWRPPLAVHRGAAPGAPAALQDAPAKEPSDE